MYKEKYLKYKQKYLILKNQISYNLRQKGGFSTPPRVESPRIPSIHNERRHHQVNRSRQVPTILNFPEFNLDDFPSDNGLFKCIAKFDEFIGKQREKKDIILRNNPKLIKFKYYDEIETVLTNEKLNCYSLLMQTILSLEQGLIDGKTLIQHNFDINFAGQAGIDVGGLGREYLNLLSKEIPYIFKNENNILELSYKLNIKYLFVVLEMIYKSRCSLITNFNILHLFNYYFIDQDVNIVELIKSTKCSNVSFSELLLNFIYYNYNKFEIFNTLDKIKEILKKENNVIVLLYLFGEYINQNPLHNIIYFNFVLAMEKEDALIMWDNYKLDNELKKLISEINTNYPNYNLFQVHSHFHYNENIDPEILISRITFEGIDNSLTEKFKSIIRNYNAALDLYTGSDPEIISENDEFKITFGDQQNFLKILLKYWSGSSYLNNYYKINYNESIIDWFHVHTCFYQIEMKVPSDTSLYDLVYGLLKRISSGFGTAG